MKGKMKNMSDIRNIIHRLRMGHSKRLIHRELGIHRSIVREWYDLSATHQWLNSESPMPSNEEIAMVCEKKSTSQSHPIDVYKEQIGLWNKEGLSSIVIQRLRAIFYEVGSPSSQKMHYKMAHKLTKPLLIQPSC
ncbi:MAG: hypothetical protein H0W50_10970 [Parachlamydiaceae bacterium]|nr:hypothetical protein [Parachlamydiaceae bacterium]